MRFDVGHWSLQTVNTVRRKGICEVVASRFMREMGDVLDRRESNTCQVAIAPTGDYVISMINSLARITRG